MGLAARQAEEASNSGGEGEDGGNTQVGQEQPQGGSSDGGQQAFGPDSASSSEVGADQDDADASDSSSSAGPEGSTSTSSDQDTLSGSGSGDVDSPAFPVSSADTAGSGSWPGSAATRSGTGSQGEEGRTETAQGTGSSSITTPISDTPQDSSSPPYTPEPTAAAGTSAMDQSTAAATSEDNNGDPQTPSPTLQSEAPAETTLDASIPVTTTSFDEPASTELSSFTPDTGITSSAETPSQEVVTSSEPTPTSETETTQDRPSSNAIAPSSPLDEPSTSFSLTGQDPSPTPSETSSTSSTTLRESLAQTLSPASASTTSSIASSPESATTPDAYSPSAVAMVGSTTSVDMSGSLAALSAASTSETALGDRIASSPAPNGQDRSTSTLDGDPNTQGNSDDDGNSNGRNPFLNGAGEGSGQNGKVIGGTVGGIIAAIVIVVVVVWLIGKRRRRKFVKPIVERMHASGSGYPLPSMLNGLGSGSGSGSAGTTAGMSSYGHHAMASASRRRSRAFSIESASTYDKIDLQTEANQTPNAMQANFPSGVGEMRQVAPLNVNVTSKQDVQPLPVGAMPYPYRVLSGYQGQDSAHQASNLGYGTYAHNEGYTPAGMARVNPSRIKPTKYHQQLPSDSSFGSNCMLDHSETADQQGQRVGYDDAYAGMSSAPLASSLSSDSFDHQAKSHRESFYQIAYNASPTQEFLIPTLVKSDSKHAIRSPFDVDDENEGMDPMPHSPTLVPTLLQRRTTDPFSNKQSLRVVNVDHDRNPGSPAGSLGDTAPAISISSRRDINDNGHRPQNRQESRPFSNWSSIAPSRASTGTMSDAYSTFHFDSFTSGGAVSGNGGAGGRASRADSLNANRRLKLDPHSTFKRSSSSLEFVTREGEILTPRQVNDVGFFKEV